MFKKAKRILGYISLALVMALSVGVFTACDSSPTELTSNMVSLEYTAVTYDGAEKKPTVTLSIEGEEVDSGEYTIEYSNNIGVGTAIVKLTSNEDSEVIKGTVSVGFEITKAVKTATTLAEINSVMANANYNGAKVDVPFTINAGETLTINEGFTLNFGDNILTNNGKLVNKGTLIENKGISGDGTITNEGEIRAEVANFADLKKAFTFANKAVLVADIGLPTATDADPELFTTEGAKYEEITLDLNGHTINRVITFESYYKVKKAILTSSNENKGVVNVVGLNDTALFFRGNETFDFEADNIKFVGDNASIKTNGKCSSSTFNVNIKNCEFDGTTTAGTYLPAEYNYTFENCTFSGYTAYYTKSGVHKLINCTFNATGESYRDPNHNGNGCDETGSALVLDSSQSYNEPMLVTIDGGTFNSKAGHAVEEYATSKTKLPNFYSTLTVKGNPTYTYGAGKVALAIPTFEMNDNVSSTESVVNQLFAKLEDNSGVLGTGVTYTYESLESVIENIPYFVEIGSVENLKSIDKLTIGTTDFIKNQKVKIAFGAGNYIEDKAFYVEGGKIYVASPILNLEAKNATSIKLNGKEFAFGTNGIERKLNVTSVIINGGENSVTKDGAVFNGYNVTIADAKFGSDLQVTYANASSADKVIVKYDVNEELTYSLQSLVSSNETNVVSIYPVGVYDDFASVPREFDGEVLKLTICSVGKGISTLNLNLDLAEVR